MTLAGRGRRARLPRAARALVLVPCLVVLSSQVPVQLTTADRVNAAHWWPTQPTRDRAAYVGPAACAECHDSKVKSQALTAMARTAARAVDSDVLGARRALTFSEGRYVHEIRTERGRSTYSVSDGAHVATAPLHWAFGAGRVGQTYLFERDATLYEARGSYFASLDALHFTPGRGRDAPRGVEAALARSMTSGEARRCFGCHTTSSSIGNRLSLQDLIPGVTCEACHGPGRAHAEAMRQHREDEGLAAIVNPAAFNPIDAVDFCGACHATFWDVTLAGQQGIAALRSQPFRLQSSRCWGDGDRRLTCQACHDPHKPLERDALAYDARCLSCHVRAAQRPADRRSSPASGAIGPPAPSCKAGRLERCATCHMPAYQVPEMHSTFTDHLIRVVRAN